MWWRLRHGGNIFFLTMEAFGKLHSCHRNYAQWDQMEEKERRLHRADITDVLILDVWWREGNYGAFLEYQA